MTQTTHLAGAILALSLTGNTDPRAAAALLVGSILPDIDHPRRCGLVPLGMRLAGIRHRGVTHSLPAMAAFALMAELVGWVLGAPRLGGWLALGYGLHLALDALNPSKVPLLWPGKWRWGIGLIRTGSMAEMLFLFGLVILYIWVQ